jgi:hypothetical protein
MEYRFGPGSLKTANAIVREALHVEGFPPCFDLLIQAIEKEIGFPR